MAFGTDESVLFREVSLIQGVLIERFHCIQYVVSLCMLHDAMLLIYIGRHKLETLRSMISDPLDL